MSSKHSGKCLNCRLNIYEGQRFCENCGNKIDANRSTVVCLGKMENGNPCNGLLRNDARFCQNCGTPSHILAPASSSNIVRNDSGSLSTRSIDDEGGDIWQLGDVELEAEALDNTNEYTDLYKQLESDGVSNIKASIENKLIRFETEEVQFGIVGRSAMGKSTFINLLLDLSPTDDGYAKVGEGNCTISMKRYTHPKFGTFTLVDFPGYGTVEMTKDKFLTEFNSVNLHYFFVFIDTVFYEDDTWLVKKLKERGVAYSFVRSKIDVLVDKARKNGTNEKEGIAETRLKLEDTIARDDILRGSKLFLISNFREYFHCGDLIRLLKHITALIPNAKLEALLFFLPLLTPELIELKCKTLRKRIKFVAFATGVVAAIPVPLIDFPVNIAIVTQELRRYIRILHLDQEYVKKVPGLKCPSLKENNLSESIQAQFVKCMKLGAVAAVSQLDWVLPGIGSAIAGPAAIVLVAHHLNSELKVLRKDAEVVYEYLSKQTSTT